MREPKIVVLIPCLNEEKTIAKVISDFKRQLPSAKIFVYDNNSTDNTRAEAETASAVVRNEPRQGKGFVVRRMFADIDADIYVMVDGDDTYNAKAVPKMIAAMVTEGLDIINGVRKDTSPLAYRRGHRFGNWMLTTMVRVVFGDQFNDILSGLKVFSRRFVKSFPIYSGGFEIETELTIHALELQMPSKEIEVDYKDRPTGSESKINSISDGIRIVRMIVDLIKQERPLLVFTLASVLLSLISIMLAYPLFVTYFETGLVPRFPTAILCTALMISALLGVSCGLILDTVTRGRQESKRLLYLSVPGIHESIEEKNVDAPERTSTFSKYL